jgi:RNA polymerase sigma-70 factor (ECF subfamily)
MIDQQALTWPTTADLPTYADEEMHQLIRRCLAGEETSYVALYNTYSSMIYRLVYSMLQHKEDAEEVLQDSFEYAFRKLAHYDANKSSFKTWLYRIAISRCRNKRRRKWLPTFYLSQLAGHDVTDKNTSGPDDVMALTEKQQQVWCALHKLSPKLRETAVLRYYESLTYSEISDILDIPAKTVESRMRLAHSALRKLLVDEDLL